MRRLALAALALAALPCAPARADDAAECREGIAMIRSEIGRKPAAPVLAKLQTALRVAEREDREGEFDECLDAVRDARKALGR